MDSFDHFIREIQQIQLIQHKIIRMMETPENLDTHDKMIAIEDNLVQIGDSVHDLTNKLPSKKTITADFLARLHHELRTPLVPVRSYVDMLLDEQFGKLTDEQKNKLRTVSTNLTKFEEAIHTFLNEKQFDIMKSNDNQNEHKIRELEQEKTVLEKMLQQEEKNSMRLSKKQTLTITGSVVSIAIVVIAYSVFISELSGQEYRVPNTARTNDGYVIQNLQGETINTWLSWKLVDGTVLHVNVINADQYHGKLDLVKDVIMSTKAIQIDDSLLGNGPKGTTSTYYLGWQGALDKSTSKTKLYIPNKLDVIASPSGEGDITIRLTDEQSGDGYSGITKSIADQTQHQILKSSITIYEVNKLSDSQFETILRHEFGHALGLAHSTSTADLMHATIQTDYPYISPCDIDAIDSLYDGNQKSEVICK